MSTIPAPSILDLAVIEGDGIGKEVVPQGLRALEAALEPAGVAVRTTDYDLGAGRWHRTGETLTDEDMAALAKHDAILLGAVGDPGVPSGVLERGLLLKLRFGFDHFVNLRPTRLVPGVSTPLAEPGEVDFLVVREGTEGPYVGNGGSMRTGTPLEVATEVSLNTAVGVERVVRYAFEQAEARRGKLTLVHKHNVLVHAGHLWRRIVEEVGAEHPGVEVDYAHVDAMMIYLVQDPSRFDVIVTDNLFGDIVTDLAGAIGGGIGLAASGNVNPTGAFPSMFEPVHGSAPDIAGQDKADPTATVLSVALLLDHLGHVEPAAAVRAAAENDLAARAADASLASRGTARIGDDLVAAITGR
ncbi:MULTISPECIES: 3-isopropylmalate dehydrogenase [Brachybacterium]|uniref:3-isopropylmalate dehydrogenase n=2 Tax=Brachybacterium TaxID=43668 RepID=A0A426SHE5_9MICO|nr:MULTISPECIES: 3-isopropylmalate dehydrogenase [Brachybacterium]RRR17557.1 3-isopropylmalate dehydrogenase [Brachybacterium paraconglomeratum]GLI31096.1 3-isopropylmalate dehydrogenase [Brachybacterium conglomeratum]GLK06477.1 3-isopropylmalate dehydrogenase [Brachybacterium conglomeratum]